MSRKNVIQDFISEKGVSQKKICDLMGISAKTLYNIIYHNGPRGISDENKRKLNNIFKSYNYGGRIS